MICQALKPSFLLPPAIALVGAATWLVSQHRAISSLELESAILRKTIASQSSGSSTDSSSRETKPAIKTAKAEEPLDWKKIAIQLAESKQHGGMGDLRGMIKLQQRLMAMSQEEMIVALDEIATLDLPRESLNQLEEIFIGPLSLKDPEFVLTRFIDRIHDDAGTIQWQLANTIQEWAKKDPASAVSWFDRQIAAGKFDSKSLDGESETRLQFERSIISVLIASDPDAAGRRIAALPADQRDDALTGLFSHLLKDEEQLAFAKIVREQVPEDDKERTLGQQASAFIALSDGYTKVGEFMDRIQATPAERTVCVEQAASSRIDYLSAQKKITREDIDTMRAWVTLHEPESTGTVTGKALSRVTQIGGKFQFSEAAELALEYHAAAGNDDLLFSFLDSWPARQNIEQARVLAEKLSDPKRREEILKSLR